MKKIVKKISLSLLALTLVLSAPVTVSAADSSITYRGFEKKFTFEPGSEYTDSDLFNNFKDVMPGDKLAETITVKNTATDCDYVKIYMRAVAHDENGNPLTYSEAYEAADGKDQTGVDGQRDETVATMADFLAQLSMKVYNGKELIYEASPDELDGLAENVLLGTFRTGETTTLTVELDVPIELDNRYANRVGEVDWVFVVEAFEEPEPTPTPSPTPEVTPTPEITPTPEATPSEPDATPEPEDEVQPESTPTPGVTTPTTGDNMNLGLYIVLVLICGATLVIVGKYMKKRNKEN